MVQEQGVYSNIKVTNQEYTLLEKGLKYNLGHKHKYWIRNLALEAESAITLLPPEEQNYMHYQVAKHIKKLQIPHRIYTPKAF